MTRQQLILRRLIQRRVGSGVSLGQFDIVSIVVDGLNDGYHLVTTGAPHGLLSDDGVVITGTSNAAFNDKRWGAILVSSPTTFSIDDAEHPETGAETATGGTWTWGAPSSSESTLLWALDATVLSSLTIDSGLITRWTTAYGTEVQFNQANGTFKPEYIEDGINGLPVIRFNGLDNYLQGNLGGNVVQPFTVVMLASLSADNGVSADANFYRGSGGGVVFYMSPGSPGNVVMFGGVGALNNTHTADPAAWVNIWNATSTLTRNEFAQASGEIGSNDLVSPLNIGVGAGEGSPAKFDVGEILLYDVAHESLSLVFRYMHNKWGTSFTP